VLAGVFVEEVDGGQIFDRDAGRCHLCGKRVDPKLRWPDPWSQSVDHLIPIARGGTHEPRNVALAHLRCNQSRGADRKAAQLLLIA
jgi:5-methylcytosine-specific restriction endonuclease McrA